MLTLAPVLARIVGKEENHRAERSRVTARVITAVVRANEERCFHGAYQVRRAHTGGG